MIKIERIVFAPIKPIRGRTVPARTVYGAGKGGGMQSPAARDVRMDDLDPKL